MRINKPKARVFTLDPGVRGCGLAYWQDGVLWAAWYVASPNARDRRATAACAMARELRTQIAGFTWLEAVVEWPVQRRRATVRRSDVSDLLAVASACAFVLSDSGQTVHSPLPEEWKGQTPKHVHNARVVGGEVALARLPRKTGYVSRATGVLSAQELSAIRWGTRERSHNIVDAVGIGLRYYGRL